jgi:hypothetical protein
MQYIVPGNFINLNIFNYLGGKKRKGLHQMNAAPLINSMKFVK